MPPPRNTIRKPMVAPSSMGAIKNRPAAVRNGLPPPMLRGRSHQPLQAVSGDSIPIQKDTLASGARWVNDAIQDRNMRQKLTLLEKRIMRPTILATAIAVAVATASTSV